MSESQNYMSVVFDRVDLTTKPNNQYRGLFIVVASAGTMRACGACNGRWEPAYCNLRTGHGFKHAQVLTGGGQFGQPMTEWDDERIQEAR